MRLRFPILTSAVLAVSLLTAPPLAAQGRRGMGPARRPPARPEKAQKGPKTPVDEFLRMSPDEQKKALDRLPPDQRERLQRRLEAFKQLPPQQRSNLGEQYRRLSELPPDRQEVVRGAFKRFGNQPPERQQAMRQELRQLSGLSPEERQARLDSPEFRSNFNHHEQQIVKDMSHLLPPE
jgi:hypothetical protein